MREALEAYSAFDKLRVHLCHGVQLVTLDRQGHWVVLLGVMDNKGGEERLTVTEAEAEALQRRLRSATDRLVSGCKPRAAR